MNSKFNRHQSYWLVLGALFTGILLRFLYLDADPYNLGAITDEGRWVQHARSLTLHGTLDVAQNFSLHFFLAPLFQFANYFMFELAGVSLLTSRIFTALCGSAILLLFWGYLRHSVTPQALLVGVSLLGFQADLVYLSRVAVPEMVIMFFQLLIYFIIVSNRGSVWRMLLAGLLLAVAVGMKATMVPFLAIFSVIILFLPRHYSETETSTRRWRDLILFWAGSVVPIAVVGLVWFFLQPELSTSSWYIIGRFLGLTTAYDVISFPFEHTLSPTFNIYSLGLWVSALGWMAGGWDEIDFQLRRYLVTSAIWFTLYLSVMLLLSYFPTYYKVHVLTPMALGITVGITHLQRLGIRKVIESFVKSKYPSSLLRLGILSLPTAVFLLPLLASALSLAGVDAGRLRIKLACLIILLPATTYVAYRFRHNRQAIGFFLIFPLIGAMVWLILSISWVSGYTFWPSADDQFHILSWSLFLLAASAISVALAKTACQWGSTGCARFVTVCAMCYLTVSLVRIAPGYINPNYSMRDLSRELGTLLSGSSAIVAYSTEGLFNENSLRYTNIIKVNSPLEMPEILVMAFRRDSDRWEDIVTQQYRLVKSYDLSFSPEYYHTYPTTTTVTVYKRKIETRGDPKLSVQ